MLKKLYFKIYDLNFFFTISIHLYIYLLLLRMTEFLPKYREIVLISLSLRRKFAQRHREI